MVPVWFPVVVQDVFDFSSTSPDDIPQDEPQPVTSDDNNTCSYDVIVRTLHDEVVTLLDLDIQPPLDDNDVTANVDQYGVTTNGNDVMALSGDVTDDDVTDGDEVPGLQRLKNADRPSAARLANTTRSTTSLCQLVLPARSWLHYQARQEALPPGRVQESRCVASSQQKVIYLNKLWQLLLLLCRAMSPSSSSSRSDRLSPCCVETVSRSWSVTNISNTSTSPTNHWTRHSDDFSDT